LDADWESNGAPVHSDAAMRAPCASASGERHRDRREDQTGCQLDAGVGPLKHGALAATSAPLLSHQLRFENGHGPAQRAHQAKHRVDTTLEATRSSNSSLHPGAKLPVIMSSPAFQGRAHVDLKRPSLVVLPVEKSVALDDTLYIDHSVLAGVSVREAFAYLFTIDGTVDDDMADMDALRGRFLSPSPGRGYGDLLWPN
jgi:hypothetical protein